MADSGCDHLLQLALGLGKLVFEVMGPVPKQDHRTGVVIVLYIDDAQAHDIIVFRIGAFVFIFSDNAIWINEAIEAIRLSVYKVGLN